MSKPLSMAPMEGAWRGIQACIIVFINLAEDPFLRKGTVP